MDDLKLIEVFYDKESLYFLHIANCHMIIFLKTSLSFVSSVGNGFVGGETWFTSDSRISGLSSQ